MEKNGTNPLKDIKTFIRMYSIVNLENVDIVFAYQAKAVVYGCVAAKIAKVEKIYALITGAGSVFNLEGFKGNLIKKILSLQYKIALSCCNCIFFQNMDNEIMFKKMELVKGQNTYIVNGSGINLNYFTPQPLPKDDVFLFIGRLLRDKGILEYLKAARIVKSKYPNAKFQVLGPFDTNPTTIEIKDMEPYIKKGYIEYLGATDDVRPFLKECSVFVLPSYHEGRSRSTIEAMAIGRPIITTDAPGCRETIIDGVNGFLVPVKDVKALAEKMIWMIENKEIREKMARESLKICQDRYDVNKVNKDLLKVMNLYTPNEIVNNSAKN
ncbi:glycosyltransferase family 4 protein [Xylanivirga thermophila]|uniref:glycosyltransferase family 4 protein n=1 Tax=Xylanivirga thermophila TaxID=2496273 RepID=UPI00101D13E1|nr:glycosyltransferase family 4 protein [Xylanivirga thermophila]